VVTVWWKGAVPGALRAVAASGHDRVTVHIRSAPHARTTLRRATSRLVEDGLRGRGPAVTEAYARVEGTGVVATVVPLRSASRVRAGTLAGLRSRLAARVGVPVTVREAPAVPNWSRQNDSSPWFGGGAMRRGGAFCSTGFPVLIGAYGRLLSAAHCDPTGNLAWTDGSGDSLTGGGAAVSVRTNVDSMLIDPVGGTDGQVHGGPWNASSLHSRYHLSVGGSASTAMGNLLCFSGANTGEHCNLQVTKVYTDWACNGMRCNGHEVRNRTAAPAGGPGDSGGPVYSNRSDGKVAARGIISGGMENIACGGSAVPVTCGRVGRFIPIADVLKAWGVRLETS
jgi:hypothetical protein